METSLATNGRGTQRFETALIGGDLAKLSTEERLSYYQRTCESLGLNPLTKPFEYINLNGKLTLYARKDCTDQLRSVHRVSIKIVDRRREDDIVTVTAQATLPDGRADESTGAVSIANLKGEALANAMMKAETKAKRRVTLSICGLGILDESEIETITDARPLVVETKPAVVEAEDPAVADYRKAIASAPTLDDLKRIGEAIAKEPARVKGAVSTMYAARRDELKATQTREPGEEG